MALTVGLPLNTGIFALAVFSFSSSRSILPSSEVVFLRSRDSVTSIRLLMSWRYSRISRILSARPS